MVHLNIVTNIFFHSTHCLRGSSLLGKFVQMVSSFFCLVWDVSWIIYIHFINILWCMSCYIIKLLVLGILGNLLYLYYILLNYGHGLFWIVILHGRMWWSIIGVILNILIAVHIHLISNFFQIIIMFIILQHMTHIDHRS